MIKAIIFDFFDVIRTDGFNAWRRRRGLEHDGALLAATQKNDRGEYTHMQFVQALADAAGETAEQITQDLESSITLNEELVDYIGTLKGNYKLAVLSNARSNYLRNELAKYDLEKYFDEIVISSEVGLIKPEPEFFELVMQRLGVQPDECVFTDDNPKYVAAAEKLGIHGIVFTGNQPFTDELQKVLKRNG
jgi:epoxide hydrolase-like predicted phosphatase